MLEREADLSETLWPNLGKAIDERFVTEKTKREFLNHLKYNYTGNRGI